MNCSELLPLYLPCLVQLRSLEFAKVNNPYPMDKLDDAIENADVYSVERQTELPGH